MIPAHPVMLALLLFAPPGLDAARAHIAAGRLDSAVHEFESAYRSAPTPEDIAPEFVRALRARAVSRFRAGDLVGSRRDLSRAEQLAPEDGTIRRDLAIVIATDGSRLLAAGDTDRALASFRDARKLDPASREIRASIVAVESSRARDALERGAYAEAIGAYRRALEIDSTSTALHLRLGEAYYIREQFDLARHHLKMAESLATTRIAGLASLLERVDREFEATRGHQMLEIGGFLVRFEGAERYDLIYEALPILQEARDRAATLLERRPRQPLTIVLYSGGGIARAVDLPDWAVGLYDGKIRFRDIELVGDPGRFRKVARHEIAHAALEEAIPGGVTPWVHEGIARYLEIDRWDPLQDAAYLVRAIKNGKTIPLGTLATSFDRLGSGTDIRLAYAESAAAVRFLGLVHGDAVIADLVAHLAAGSSIEAAVDAITFQDLDSFQKRVHQWVIWEYDRPQ